MRSSVEAPFTFFQIERKGFLANPIEPASMPFGLVSEILNPINVVRAFYERGLMIDAHMMKTRHLQGVITGQMIRIDNTVGHNHLLDDRQQGHAIGIRNGCRIHFPTPLQHPEN